MEVCGRLRAGRVLARDPAPYNAGTPPSRDRLTSS